MAKKKQNSFYTYSEPKYSRRGAAAAAMAAVSLVVLLSSMLLSGIGIRPALVGAIGAAGFASALIGVVIGLESFRDTCRSYFLSKLGTILSGLMFAAWFLLVCVGLANS